jgi:hypothetical protein
MRLTIYERTVRLVAVVVVINQGASLFLQVTDLRSAEMAI